MNLLVGRPASIDHPLIPLPRFEILGLLNEEAHNGHKALANILP